MKTPTIALIGTEGSGKTVLTAALAKRLSVIDVRGTFLNPQGVKTLKYVENVWDILQHGEWPSSTPPGQLFELVWKLGITGDFESELRLIDTAGQDLRLLFGDDLVSVIDSQPEIMKRLVEYCRSSDIVLFLINLKDFSGEGNYQQKTNNEAALKAAMDYLTNESRKIRMCLLITQSDLYYQLAEDHGGWNNLIQKSIPYIDSAYIKAKNVSIFPVSAVNKTRVVIDENGKPNRVPEIGFGSDGFDDVIDWLINQVRDHYAEQMLDVIPTLSQIDNSDLTSSLSKSGLRLYSPFIGYSFVIFAIVFYFLIPSQDQPSNATSTSSESTKPTLPIPTLSNTGYKDHPEVFDDWVESFGYVTNQGASGLVLVTTTVSENGILVDNKSQLIFLNSGQQQYFTFELTGIYAVKNPHEVNFKVSLP